MFDSPSSSKNKKLGFCAFRYFYREIRKLAWITGKQTKIWLDLV